MRRVLVPIALLLLLLPGSPRLEPRVPPDPRLLVDARPVTLEPDDPARADFGPLQWRGGWVLSSKNKDFGGISSIAVLPEGRLLGLSDGSDRFGFRDPDSDSHGRQYLAPLPGLPPQKVDRTERDSESMTHDPDFRHFWVGFEVSNRICRYSAGFARRERCVVLPDMKKWWAAGGAEAMIRLASGRFAVFSEMTPGPGASTVALLFKGDPTDPATPRPLHFGYRAPQGFRITDVGQLPDGRLLALNRRATIYDGFTALVTLFDIRGVREGQVVPGKVIARFTLPSIRENFEALTVDASAPDTIVWIASDDNNWALQRTLLLKFRWPDPDTQKRRPARAAFQSLEDQD